MRAILVGHAATFTGASRWAQSREGLAQAIRGALDEAGCAPEEIDVVFADALGVPEADRAEALAIADALGAHGRKVPVTAPKTGIGRAYGGAPVLDTAAAVLAMEHGLVPPTPHVFDICHDLDLVTERARPRTCGRRWSSAGASWGRTRRWCCGTAPPTPRSGARHAQHGTARRRGFA